jgi:hypothetical protein
MDIEAVVKSHERELLSHPDVTAVGIGFEGHEPVILVFVGAIPAETDRNAPGLIPATLDGYRVVIEPELRVGGPG